MIIDMRCRLTTSEGSDYFRIQTKKSGMWERVDAFQEGTEEAFFAEVAQTGVTTAVSVSGNNPGMKLGSKDLPDRTTSNDYMADVQRRNWGRFIGVAGIDAGAVFHDPIKEIERCAELGLRAIFIEPGRSPGCLLSDPRLYPIYEKCLELDLTVIPQTSGPLGGKNIDYANPKYVEQVAEDFPDLRIICGHGHYPYVREAITMCTRRDNVYLSPDIYLRQLGTEDWLKAINENIGAYFGGFGLADRFVFGSAYPLFDLKEYIRFFFSLPWKPEVLSRLLYKNALRALNLQDDPVFRQMYGLDLPDEETDPTPEFVKAGG
ncbi:MAG: amidohydrolase family protein [Chloroflexi bacterium]|nr:amidohydrolase family protein [Chloroflexota bacterium]